MLSEILRGKKTILCGIRMGTENGQSMVLNILYNRARETGNSIMARFEENAHLFRTKETHG